MMPALTERAALEYAIKQHFGEVDETLLRGCLRSSRASRIMFSSRVGSNFTTPQSADLHADCIKNDPPPINPARDFFAAQVRFFMGRQKMADPETIHSRRFACASCPHRTTAPETKLYHLGKLIVRPDGDDICGLCGCFLSEKTKRLNESCPAYSETSLTHSRWGEIMK